MTKRVEGTPDRRVNETDTFGNGGGGDGCCDETNTTLAAILTELGQKLEAGQEVALTAATLAALETITVVGTDFDIRDLAFATDKVDVSNSSVSVSNFPATQPVSGTVTAVGPAADGAAVSGNPVRIAGKDSGGLTQDARTDTTGNIGVYSKTASAAHADGFGNTAFVELNEAGAAIITRTSFGYMFNGTTWDRIRGSAADGLLVNLGANNDVTNSEAVAASAALSNVNDSATSVTLQAANASRRGWYCFNDSTQALMVKFGATASATSFTVRIAAGGYYEMPKPIYTGVIDGIWAADSTGAARMTELT